MEGASIRGLRKRVSVIRVKRTFRTVRNPAEETEMLKIQVFRAPDSGSAQGQQCISADEQGGFVQGEHHIMRAFFHGKAVIVPGGTEAHKKHVLRKIDRPADSILFVDRGNHAVRSQHDLVLNMPGNFVPGIVKGQRPEHEIRVQSGLHDQRIQVWNQGVAHREYIPHVLPAGEAVDFLLARVQGGMIPHKRRVYAKLKPAQQKVFRGIVSEPAQIGAGKEIAAHVQAGHHLQVHKNMRPPGLVVALPDARKAVGADIAGA